MKALTKEMIVILFAILIHFQSYSQTDKVCGVGRQLKNSFIWELIIRFRLLLRVLVAIS